MVSEMLGDGPFITHIAFAVIKEASCISLMRPSTSSAVVRGGCGLADVDGDTDCDVHDFLIAQQNTTE